MVGQHSSSCVVQVALWSTPINSCCCAGAEAAGSSVDDPAAVEKQQPSSQAAQRMAAAGSASPSSNSSSASSSADCWDASDDWEPDVSCLRSASSFERQREKTVVLQPFQSTPHPQRRASGSPPQPARFALSEPATSVRGSSGGGSSKPASSAGGSRPRGRGQSKCGLPTSDSEDEALLAAGGSHSSLARLPRPSLELAGVAACSRHSTQLHSSWSLACHSFFVLVCSLLLVQPPMHHT